MPSDLPFYKVYPGDEKRNGSRQVSLAAEGLLKRLKDEAHDTERRGYFLQNRQPMTPGYLARICNITPSELMALLTELVCVKLVGYAEDQTLFVPEIVRQEQQRVTAIKTGSKGGNPRLINRVNGGVNGGVNPIESDNDVVDVVVVFEGVWGRYPRKLGKTQALRSFKAAFKKDKTCIPRMIAALTTYLSYLKANGTEEKYIKHGSTWFKNWEEWENYEPRSNGSVTGDFAAPIPGKYAHLGARSPKVEGPGTEASPEPTESPL